MSDRNSVSQLSLRGVLELAVVVAGAVLALSLAARAGAAPHATAAGIADEIQCPAQPSRTGWERRVPAGKDQAQNASCDDCWPIPAYAKCKLWWGGQSAGGGLNVDHGGWPGIDGIRWEVVGDDQLKTHRKGTRFNDEFLGRHHDDTFYGGPGDDVLWGDANNGPGLKPHPHQKDKLVGGKGNDWIYASPGRNTIKAGRGNDIVIAYNGRGTIDCGAGKDKVVLRKKTPYKVKNCEKVAHPAAKRK